MADGDGEAECWMDTVALTDAQAYEVWDERKIEIECRRNDAKDKQVL